MPVEELGEEPGRPLLVGQGRELRARRVHPREVPRQRRDDRGHGRLPLRRLGGLHRGVRERGAGNRDPQPRTQVQPAALEPLAEAPRAQDVVAVVALDLAEDLVADETVRGGAAAQPRFELDDAAPRVLQVDFAVKAVEGLEALDRVALDAGPDSLSHDAIEVDEDAPLEEPVDLVLASRMTLGEARERGLLVRRVVVHVECRVRIEPRDQEIHQPLEGRLLGGKRHEAIDVAAPEGVEPRGRRSGLHSRPARVILDQRRVEHAEQVVDAVVERERIALEVEEEVVSRRLGQDEKAAIRDECPCAGLGILGPVGLEELPEGLAAVLALDLDPGLLADARERDIAAAVELRPQRELEPGKASTGPDRARRRVRGALLEPAPLSAADSRHEAQVIVGTAPVPADRPPAADVAVLDGIRVRVRGRVGRWADALVVRGGDEVRLHAAVVGHVVVDAEDHGLASAPAERDVEPLGLPPLHPRQLVDVRADLEDGAGLDVAGELGVGDFVVPGAERAVRLPGCVVDPQEEVGVAAPCPVEERGLVDDIRAVPHRLAGELGGLIEARARARGRAVAWDLDDPPAGCPEVVKVSLLVLVAALLDELDGGVAADRLRDETGHRRALQLEAVRTGEEADEIGGRVDGSAVEKLHAQRILGAGRASLYGAPCDGNAGTRAA